MNACPRTFLLPVGGELKVTHPITRSLRTGELVDSVAHGRPPMKRAARLARLALRALWWTIMAAVHVTRAIILVLVAALFGYRYGSR